MSRMTTREKYGINITPARCVIFFKNFMSRVDRMVKNEYTNPRFRTYDFKRLLNELEEPRWTNFENVCKLHKDPDKAWKVVLQAREKKNSITKMIEQ